MRKSDIWVDKNLCYKFVLEYHYGWISNYKEDKVGNFTYCEGKILFSNYVRISTIVTKIHEMISDWEWIKKKWFFKDMILHNFRPSKCS